ncbi:MAG: TlpA family protein disulfide reductase [Gammaproteobacteria bacterium]|nr:TlpA family protein disulfide reductase [Gammaproteobacteria bacterium]
MMSIATDQPRGAVLLGLTAALVMFLSACEEAGEGNQGTQAETVETTESADSRNWKLIQAYNDLDRAWHAVDNEISRSDASDEEKERRRTEERGEHPDIVLAVVAARALAWGDGEHAVDAATFLIESTRGLSPTEASDIEFGNAALKRIAGADWSVVEKYKDDFQAWKDEDEARREAFRSPDNKGKPFIFIPPPKSLLASAAAQAILEAGPDHENARDAADFLIDPATRNPFGMLMAAQALAEHFPDFDEWPELLMNMDNARPSAESEPFDEFMAEMASGAEDPVVRATARYFGAKGLVNSVNTPSMEAAERQSRREQALEMALSLSAGVEDQDFVKTAMVDGEEVAQTLADAEAALVHGIRHTVVGATVADETGNRLDGTEDTLSAYAGQVVLMDFWATWCGPCIAALPQMRGLAGKYPEDQFEILGISFDAELETVTDFMEDRSMPWSHWHVGVNSEMDMAWDIKGLPTYVVIDRDGVILSRGHNLDAAAKAIEQAVNGEA